MPSGAGRTVTRRERTAASMRRTTAAASSSAATRRAAFPVARTPSRPSTGPSLRSSSARSCADSVADCCTTSTACRSWIAPAVSAFMVSGSSVTRARLSPTNRSPSVGDSRRARATSAPTDRATSWGATRSREHRRACVARACVADADPLRRSSAPTRSTRSRSDSPSTSTEANHAWKAATGAVTPASAQPEARGCNCATTQSPSAMRSPTLISPAMNKSYKCPPTAFGGRGYLWTTGPSQGYDVRTWA